MENPLEKIDKKLLAEVRAELLEPIFSEERYKYFRESGLTEEEIATLERVEAASNVTELLPDDVGPLFEELNKLSNDPATFFAQLKQLYETDPNKYAQFLALVQAVDMGFEGETKTNANN